MSTEINSPIISSRHHDNISGEDNKPEDNKKPEHKSRAFIVIAIIIFMMGMGAVFFLAASDQPEEELIEPIEAY